jgi:prepilin-type N-terminal cleavage/methylation domain-containing protein
MLRSRRKRSSRLQWPKVALARPSRDESGFTMVELLVALMILAVVLISVAFSLTSGLTNVAFSQQEETATGLANKAIEQIRGMPYSTLKAGSNDSDSTLTADVCSTCAITQVSGVDTYGGETLVHSTWSGGTVAPLNPHASTVAINKTTYTVKSYVTLFNGISTEYRVTTVVTWTPSDRPGANTKVKEQTVIFSPSNGCLSPNTHPYAAPCQPYFQTTGTIGQGYIQIGPNAGEAAPISGIPFTSANLYLPRADNNIEMEQVATLLGGSYTSGASLNSGSSLSQGQLAGTAQSDNDPGSNTSPAASSTNFQTATYIYTSSGSGNPNSLTLQPGTNDSGYAVDTAAAGTAQTSGNTIPACNDLTTPATPQNTGQPCGETTVAQSGTMSASMGLFGGGSYSLGSAPLATVAAPSSSTFTTGVFAARYASAGTNYCTATNGDGCAHSGAQRQIGQVSIGGLPAQIFTDNFAPAGWSSATNYLFQLSNYSDSASAESGISPASPTVSVPASGQTAPTLKFWNGTGYTSYNTWPATATNVPISPVTITDNKGPGALTITISANLTYGGYSTSTSLNSGCATTCTARASTNSPLKGDVFYTVQWNGTTLADLDIHVDLGSLAATTAYQEAPSAG